MRLAPLAAIALLGFAIAGPSGCDYDDDCGADDDDDFDDDDFDDDDLDDDFDDDDFDDCSTVVIIGVTGGSVVVLVTDRPRPELQAAHVTLADVALASDEVGSEPLYRWEAGHRMDLLSLRGTQDTRRHDLLAARGGLEPAAYRGLRFAVRDPTLVLASGEVIGAGNIHLAGGGRVAIEFAEPLLLGPADVAYLVLDFDLDRSVAEHAGESAPRWRLRPVVLSDVRREDVGRTVRAPTDLAGTVASVGQRRTTFTIELSNGRGTLRVRLPRSAAILDERIERVEADAIRAGSQVLVRGAWTAEGEIAAEAVVLGETFLVAGTIRDLSGAGGCLDAGLVVPPGQALAGEFRFQACPEALISRDGIDPARLGDLGAGRRVAVLARAAGGLPARAALIDLRPPIPGLDAPRPGVAGAERLAGLVAAVDESRGLVAVVSPAGLAEVWAGGAVILLIEEQSGGLAERLIPLGELAEGMRLEVEGGTAPERPARLLVATREDRGRDRR